MPGSRRKRTKFKEVHKLIVIILAVFFADRITKYLLESLLIAKGGIMEIIPPFFNLTLSYNKGAAFGILNRHTLFLAGASIIGILFLTLFYFKEKKQTPSIKYPIAFIIGGALGNLYDRIVYNHVIDFFDFDFFNIDISAFKFKEIFHFTGYHLHRWPAFNIADSFIFIGVFLLIIVTLISEQKQKCTQK